MMHDRFLNVRLISSDRNLGYAAGNNRAVAQARGDYLLLLNPDTLVSQKTIHALIDFMDAHPRAGACSPQLRLPDDSPQPYTFGEDPKPGYLLRRGWHRLVHHRALHDWGLDAPQIVPWVSGAAMLARREAWSQVGGFDENFFMYFEDNDLCLRMRKQGWEVWYNPTVAITHLGGQSAQYLPSSSRTYQQSLIYFYRKHYGRLAEAAIWLGLATYRCLQRLLAGKSREKPNQSPP
jgi:GT2 family glycosyltransferase